MEAKEDQPDAQNQDIRDQHEREMILPKVKSTVPKPVRGYETKNPPNRWSNIKMIKEK